MKRPLLLGIVLAAGSLLLSLYFGVGAHAATTSAREIIACSTATDCLNVDNLLTGLGISSYAHNNAGVRGSTVAVNGPSSVSNGLPYPQVGGVVGNDFAADPATDNNAGVIGFSKISNGVVGITQNALNCGCGTDVFTAGLIPAIFGEEVGPPTAFGGGVTNVGVLGRSITRAGVAGLTRSGYAVVGRAFSGTGVLAVSRAAGGVALAARTLQGSPIFRGFNATKEVASIDSNGNMVLAGTLHTSSTPVLATRSSTGEAVATYGARETLPTIEDFGQAQLQNGFARVQIDPAFVQLMDRRAPYMVFLSPEGDNRGLYITNKTYNGFIVRESAGGRSVLTFSYRLVARAYGNDLPRLSVDGRLQSVPGVRERSSVRSTLRYINE